MCAQSKILSNLPHFNAKKRLRESQCDIKDQETIKHYLIIMANGFFVFYSGITHLID